MFRLTNDARAARRFGRVAFVGLVVVTAACSSSAKSGAPATRPAGGATTASTPKDTSLGRGVTATQIKLGVMMIDFSCIEQFVDAVEPEQQRAFQVYVDDINAKGGINGRKIVPVFKTYCPLDLATELTACTSLTDDSQVFAAIGTFYDPNGSTQLCFAKQHKTIIIGSPLTQALIERGPPGLMLTTDITSERRLRVIMALLKKEGTLAGKKVAVVDIAADHARVKSVVGPALRDLGVQRGTDATLTITGPDTTAALSQLDSFVEHWKSDGTNALILVGEEVSSKQFVERIKAAVPRMLLVSDTTSVLNGARDEQKAHMTPNPYDGILTAEGQTGIEHTKTPHFTYCRDIWEKATGEKVPSPNVVIKLPNGKQNDIYAEVEDACAYTTFFKTIATRVGPYLNDTNWVNTVNDFGPIDDTSTIYASVHRGKYDADDTYGLVAYDPRIGAAGDWDHVTPEENVSGS
jgi:ABC-type branched-subunit amino acid transport system substrate-binding protein